MKTESTLVWLFKMFLICIIAMLFALITGCSETKRIEKKNDCYHKPYKKKAEPIKSSKRFKRMF